MGSGNLFPFVGDLFSWFSGSSDLFSSATISINAGGEIEDFRTKLLQSYHILEEDELETSFDRVSLNSNDE